MAQRGVFALTFLFVWESMANGKNQRDNSGRGPSISFFHETHQQAATFEEGIQRLLSCDARIAGRDSLCFSSSWFLGRHSLMFGSPGIFVLSDEVEMSCWAIIALNTFSRSQLGRSFCFFIGGGDVFGVFFLGGGCPFLVVSLKGSAKEHHCALLEGPGLKFLQGSQPGHRPDLGGRRQLGAAASRTRSSYWLEPVFSHKCHPFGAAQNSGPKMEPTRKWKSRL